MLKVKVDKVRMYKGRCDFYGFSKMGSALPYCYFDEIGEIDVSWRENPESIFLEPCIMR